MIMFRIFHHFSDIVPGGAELAVDGVYDIVKFHLIIHLYGP